MSEAKFTKGEWRVLTRDNSKDLVEYEEVVIGIDSYLENPHHYYACHKIVIESDDEEGMANARLIAAAPEMYEMLQEMIDQYDYEGCTEYEYRLIKSARELLAKARGEKETNK